MCEYIDGTFALHVPEKLTEFFKKLGYEECKVGLMHSDTKPLILPKEPAALKFYQNFKFSSNKGNSDE